MNNENINETLKAMIDELKEHTLSKLLQQDTEYRVVNQERSIAESQYLELQLTNTQKETIHKFLSANDESNMEYSTLSYLAGVYDSEKIIKNLHIDVITDEDTTIIRNLYRGKVYPSEKIRDSATTKKLWQDYDEMEMHLNKTLSNTQVQQYSKIHDTVVPLIYSSMEDAFVYGFQMGLKLMFEVHN